MGSESLNYLADRKALDQANLNLQNAKKEIDELKELGEELLIENEELEKKIVDLGNKNLEEKQALEETISENNQKISENNETILNLQNQINSLFSEELRGLAEVLKLEFSEEKFSDNESKKIILISSIEEIKELISINKYDKTAMESCKNNLLARNNLIEDRNRKILNIAKKLFPEENFSNEISEEIFEKILEKIQNLIDHFTEGGKKELDEKNQKIKELSDLIEKLKLQKNYLAENEEFLEFENEFLGEENSDLKILNQNSEFSEFILSENNKSFLYQINDLSRELNLSKSEIKILKSAFDEVLDEKISLEKINEKLEEKLYLEKLDKENLSGIINNLSEEKNKISEELEKIKTENLAQKETIENQQNEISSKIEVIQDQAEMIKKLKSELEKNLNISEEEINSIIDFYQKENQKGDLNLEELKSKFRQENSKLIQKNKDLEGIVSGLFDRIFELKDENAILEEKNQEKENENSELKGKISGFEKSISDTLEEVKKTTENALEGVDDLFKKYL